jgi:DMSO/TMAO reductase YedYZ heme-binding membrane subunit
MRSVVPGRPATTGGASLVGWSAAAVVAMAATILLLSGTGPVGLRTVVRATARTSATFFWLAFVASSLRQLAPSSLTAWLLARRRELGLSFAASHAVHLSAVGALFWTAPGWDFRPIVAGAGGCAAIVFAPLGVAVLVALTATSFDRTAAWLGPRRWHRLHTVGTHVLWLEFLGAFGRRALRDPFYVPFALAFVVAMVLRLAAVRRRLAPAAA